MGTARYCTAITEQSHTYLAAPKGGETASKSRNDNVDLSLDAVVIEEQQLPFPPLLIWNRESAKLATDHVGTD